MYITQVPLQVQSGDKVLTALEASKCYVPMLLLDVNFQGEPLSGLELAVVRVDEETHVLCLDVAVQSTFPPALEATELAGELHLKKVLTENSSSKTSPVCELHAHGTGDETSGWLCNRRNDT